VTAGPTTPNPGATSASLPAPARVTRRLIAEPASRPEPASPEPGLLDVVDWCARSWRTSPVV